LNRILNSPIATDLKKTMINNIYLKFIHEIAIELNLNALIHSDYLKQLAKDRLEKTNRSQTFHPILIDPDQLIRQFERYYLLFLLNLYYLKWMPINNPFIYRRYRFFTLQMLKNFIYIMRSTVNLLTSYRFNVR